MKPVLVILTYHYLIDSRVSLRRDIWGSSILSFQEQVARLNRNFSVLGARNIPAFFRNEIHEKKIFVAFSFDDGLIEHSDVAAELLDSLGISGLFFVPTCLLENRPPLPAILHFTLAQYRLNQTIRWINEVLEELGSPEKFIKETASDATTNISALKNFLRSRLSVQMNENVLQKIYDKGLKKDHPHFVKDNFVDDVRLNHLIRSGHVVGAHTDSHPSLSVWQNDDFSKREIDLPIKKLKEVTKSEI